MRVIGSGWWLGRIWLEIEDGTRAQNPVIWFDNALGALEFLGKCTSGCCAAIDAAMDAPGQHASEGERKG